MTDVVKSPELLALESQLADINAKRAQFKADREAKRALPNAKQELERAARELADEEAVATAEDEHGEMGVHIMAVRTECGIVIVKRPAALIFRRFQDQGKSASQDLEKLVRPCLVHPNRESFDHYCDEQPATLLRVADAVAHLAGVRNTEVSGK